MAHQHIHAALALESKRFLGKRNMTLFFLTFLVMIFFTNKGIIEQKKMPGKIKKFQEIQEKVFSRLPNYLAYSLEGEKFLFIPSPIEVFCQNWGIPPDVNAKINSIIDLKLSSNLKGRGLMFGFFFGRIDFAVIVLIWVSLLAMGFGYESLHTREYLKFLSSLCPRGKLFFPLVLSRFLLLAAAFLLLSAGTVVFALLRGLVFSSTDYTGLMIFLLVSLFVLLVFFSLGVFFGTFGSPRASLLYMLTGWILLVFALPGAFVSLNAGRFPDTNRDFQTELNNFKIVTEFEREVFKKYGSYSKNNKDIFKNFAETYWSSDFKKIEDQEFALKSDIESDVDRVSRLSALLPTTFFMYSGYEMSSCSYGNFIDFYSYTMAMRAKFVRFWIDRVYYHDPTVMVPFIKGDENLFRARSRVPRYLLPGLLLTLLYSVILLGVSYTRYKHLLAPQAKNPAAFENIDIQLGSTGTCTIRSYYHEFTGQFLALFFGKPALLAQQVSFGERKPTGEEIHDFLYVPNPGLIPGDLRAMDLMQLVMRLRKHPGQDLEKLQTSVAKEKMVKRFKDLEPEDKAGIMMRIAQAAGRAVVIFHDFIDRIPPDHRSELAEQADQLMKNSPLLINLVSSDNIWLDHDRMITIYQKNNQFIRL